MKNGNERQDENKQIVDEIKEWQSQSFSLKEEMIDYTWNYIKKICSNCSEEKRKKHNCIKLEYWKDGSWS